MNKTPIFYTEQQTNEILDYIREALGKPADSVAHEIKSEYVHTDVAILAPEDDAKTYVTFGMGAREMASPLAEWKRTELALFASEAFDPRAEEGMILAGELVGLSKFPFRNETWFGPGHTIDASETFKRAFGYDGFLFFSPNLSAELTGIGKVNLLFAVPIYEEEREWIMAHDSFDYLLALWEAFGGDMLRADLRRERFIPENP